MPLQTLTIIYTVSKLSDVIKFTKVIIASQFPKLQR